jgi:eukaryotic-like serine/threonine-protein kinase
MVAPTSPFAPTEEVPFHDFHLIGLLGEGGTGTVYSARHRGGEVALKVLRQGLALSERERGRFLDEARRMRRVEHEGLVTLLGSGVLSDGRPYLCMPRLRGETLASRLDRGKLPLADAVAIFDTLAQAVAVLHRAGLIHRDIKPENIFLENPTQNEPGGLPHPVLLDFGIARDVADGDSTTTSAGQTRGTPAYMAPERFFGSVADVRSDVYELAVTLYAMLTGRLPWDNAQSAATRLSPMHPDVAGVALPRELSTVILRALSTRPEVRPESADAFADLVRRAAATSTDPARTTAAMTPIRDSDASGVKAREASTGALVQEVGATGRRRRSSTWGLVVASALVLAWVARAELVHAPHPPPPEEPVVAVTAPPRGAAEELLDAPPKTAIVEPVPVTSTAPPAVTAPSQKRSTPPSSATGAPAPSSSESPARYYRDRK